jgi:hypothetical protein
MRKPVQKPALTNFYGINMVSTEQPQSRFYFLFRTDKGVIDVGTWLRGSCALLALNGVLTLIWMMLLPYANRGLNERALLDMPTLFIYIYLFIYAEIVILSAVCFYNLTAKRFRACQQPAALAGLIPFTALITGAYHWLQPRVNDVIPDWSVPALDVMFIACCIWSVMILTRRRSAADVA